MSVGTLHLHAGDPRAIGDARRTLSGQLARWQCGRSDDALLVFSELVTNAVNHAGGATRIVIEHGDRSLRFEIHDRMHAIPRMRPADDTPGGFGLRIVTSLSTHWGWDQTADGKVVWCIVACCGAPEEER